jgi:surface polysaccharide O-acyltransferase-like enzyme
MAVSADSWDDVPRGSPGHRPQEKVYETWIDNARIVAIFLVVFFHTSLDIPWDQGEMAGTLWWVNNLKTSLLRWMVPLFVMLSGYLLLDPVRKESPSSFFRKRSRRIFLPLIFWTIFYLLWGVLRDMIAEKPIIMTELIQRVASGKPYYHMWFLYMFFPLTFLTPYFRKFLYALTHSQVNILCGGLLLIAAVGYVTQEILGFSNSLFILWFIYFLPYYFCGYKYNINPGNLRPGILWSLYWGSVTTALIGNYLLSFRFGLVEKYFHGHLSITSILKTLALMGLFMRFEKALVPG